MVALPYELEQYYKKRVLALTHGTKIRGLNSFTEKFNCQFEALAHDILRTTIVHYPDEPVLTLDDAYAFMFRISDHWDPIFEEDLMDFSLIRKAFNKVNSLFIYLKEGVVLKYGKFKD